MPAGNDYKVQGQLYALDTVIIPKLQAMLPAVLLGLVVSIGGFIVLRRRRRAA